MCGRVAQHDSWADIVAIMRWPAGMADREDAEPRYNVAPSTMVKLLAQDGGPLVLQLVRWRWRPNCAKDRTAPINARVEKVAHGPFFHAIWTHRAVCPISGWFEWVDEGGPKKQPYFIRWRDGKPCLAAAIGQFPHGEREAGEQDGFVIITADDEGGMVDVHDRRQVILSPDLAAECLDSATPRERAEQMALHQGEPPEMFEWYRVNTAVGSVRNHGADLCARSSSAGSAQPLYPRNATHLAAHSDAA